MPDLESMWSLYRPSDPHRRSSSFRAHSAARTLASLAIAAGGGILTSWFVVELATARFHDDELTRFPSPIYTPILVAGAVGPLLAWLFSWLAPGPSSAPRAAVEQEDRARRSWLSRHRLVACLVAFLLGVLVGMGPTSTSVVQEARLELFSTGTADE